MLKIFALIIFTFQLYATEIITIGASSVPHADILKQADKILEKKGYQLKIVVFSDYITPNIALTEKSLDANFFQHQPYLDEYNKSHKTNIIALTTVHFEPMGIYSNPTNDKFIASKKGSDIKTAATVAIPNDPTNEQRALELLQTSGVIKLKKTEFPTAKDITYNPLKLKIVELDAAMLPRMLIAEQVDIAVINANYAINAGLQPKSAVINEKLPNKYANIIAIRPDELKSDKMNALKAAVNSPEIKQFIKTNYLGSIMPAF